MRGTLLYALRLGMTGALFLSVALGSAAFAKETRSGRYSAHTVSVTEGQAAETAPDTGAGNTSVTAPDAGTGNTSVTAPDAGTGNTSVTAPDTGTGNSSVTTPDTGTEKTSESAPDAGTGNTSGTGSDTMPDISLEEISDFQLGLTAPDDEDGDFSQADARKRCVMAKSALEASVTPCRRLRKYDYLYIGASRTNQIRKSVKDSKTYFEAAPGAGSKWFGQARNGKKPCLLTIRSYLAVCPRGNVIIELGNNDVRNVDVYIYVYKKLIEAYPEANIWFVDVLPGSGPKSKGKQKNEDRQAFNARLHAEFPDRCLGGYSYLLHRNDFRTKDGTHYPAFVARNLYKYVMKKLGRKISYSGKAVIEG